jgi:hypothetical protein
VPSSQAYLVAARRPSEEPVPVPARVLLLLVLLQTRLLQVHARVSAGRRDRGDVPGWVLITLMTAGIVTALWAIAGPRLSAILTNALNSVTGPGGSG